MRLFFVAVLAAGLAVLLLAGRATPGQRDTIPDTYREGVIGRAERIHPLLATGAGADVAALVFDSLFRLGGDGTVEPNLAERWEVTPDGLTYTVVLRDDVTWHDGTPFDALDVTFTIERLQAPDFAGDAALAGLWTDIDIFAVDPTTVLFRLPTRLPDFPTRLTVAIIPRHHLTGLDDESASAALLTDPVGTGPFRLVGLGPLAATLERNTSYHLGVPILERFEFRFFDSETGLLAALDRGEIDGTLLPSAVDTARVLGSDASALAGTRLQRNAFVILYMNNRATPLDDRRVRAAIAATIDRAALVQVAGVEGRPGEGVIVPGSWARGETGGSETGAPSLAAELAWGRSGWTLENGVRARDGIPLALELVTNADPTRTRIAEAVAAQLRSQGVDVTVLTMSSTELLTSRLVPRRYQLAIFGWESTPDPDPYSGWHSSQISEQGRNIAGFESATADRLLELARQTLDGSDRRQLYESFETALADDAGSLVLYYPERVYVHPSSLTPPPAGLLFEPTSRLRDVYRWSLER